MHFIILHFIHINIFVHLQHQRFYVKTSIKIFFIICIIPLISCKKNQGNASWDINVLSPLINTSLGVDNIIPDSLIHTNADTSIEIVYNTSLYNFSVDSLVNIPDTFSKQQFNPNFTVYNIPPGSQIYNQSNNNNLSFGSAQITKIIVKSGFINISLKNTLKGKMLCTYKIPYATLNGTPLTITELVPAGSISAPSTFNTKVDISGYSLNLMGQSGNSYNIISSNINIVTDPNGGSDTIQYQDNLNVIASFENIVIDYAKGYFGSQHFKSGQMFSSFKLFNKITSGNINLQNIHLLLNISNGFGIDASMILNELKSINNRTGNTVALNSSVIGSVIHVNRAQETFNPANPVTPSLLTFNLDNSNFKQLIENMPDQLEFSLNMTSNPLGNVSSGNDFIYNQYGFNANIDLEIPLSIIATNLTLTDTVAINFSKPSGYEINQGTLTLLADNGFPFTANTQLYLLDNSGHITDSLITANKTINSAKLDANNKVISSVRSVLLIPVNVKKMNELYAAKKMKIVARFNTSNQPSYVKIYSDYRLNMKLTGNLNMTVN